VRHGVEFGYILIVRVPFIW